MDSMACAEIHLEMDKTIRIYYIVLLIKGIESQIYSQFKNIKRITIGFSLCLTGIYTIIEFQIIHYLLYPSSNKKLMYIRNVNQKTLF